MPTFEVPERTPHERPDPVVLAIDLPADGFDATAVAERLRARLADLERGVVVCDAGARRPCDIGTLDLVARLALAARQSGCRLVLRNPSPQLRSLLGLAGLTAVIPCAEESVGESER